MPELRPLIARKFCQPGDVDAALDMVKNSNGVERARELAYLQAELAADAARLQRRASHADPRKDSRHIGAHRPGSGTRETVATDPGPAYAPRWSRSAAQRARCRRNARAAGAPRLQSAVGECRRTAERRLPFRRRPLTTLQVLRGLPPSDARSALVTLASKVVTRRH